MIVFVVNENGAGLSTTLIYLLTSSFYTLSTTSGPINRDCKRGGETGLYGEEYLVWQLKI